MIASDRAVWQREGNLFSVFQINNYNRRTTMQRCTGGGGGAQSRARKAPRSLFTAGLAFLACAAAAALTTAPRTLGCSSAELCYNRGTALMREAQQTTGGRPSNEVVDAAVSAFSAALVHDPTSAKVMAALGPILHDLGRYEEAFHVLHKLSTVAPRSADTFAYKGHCLIGLGRPADSVPSYRTAASLMGTATNYYNLGNALTKAAAEAAAGRQGNADNGFAASLRTEAVASLEKAVQIDPEMVDAHSSLGSLYFELGDKYKVIGAMERVIQLSPHQTKWCP